MRQILFFMAMVSLMFAQPGQACLWDNDTLSMERQRFPEANELIAGHFIRHSTAYYEWKIADRTAKPADQLTPIDFDDVAVAYDKLGKHDKAIATIHEKTARWPEERQYETEANLGTFHIHAGHYEEGLKHLNRAIEINPDAHFGREIYQKLLVEYVIESRQDDGELPLAGEQPGSNRSFTSFLLSKREIKDGEQLAEIEAAVKGVLGMMRFGRHDSPILLEALGDLMLTNGYLDDSKMLAARAYLKASYSVDDPAASAAYRTKVAETLEMQQGVEFVDVESELRSETSQGDDFFAKISEDEKAWIVEGKNLDAEFAGKYYADPEFSLFLPGASWMNVFQRNAKWLIALIVILIAGIILRRKGIAIHTPKRSTITE